MRIIWRNVEEADVLKGESVRPPRIFELVELIASPRWIRSTISDERFVISRWLDVDVFRVAQNAPNVLGNGHEASVRSFPLVGLMQV